METQTNSSAAVAPRILQELPPVRTPRSPSRFLFESLLIIISVVLGFVVTQWRDNIADRELAERVLDDVLVEVQANLELINAQTVRREAVMQTLMSSLPELAASPPEESGLEFFFSRVGGDWAGRPLRRAAWDAAVSSGALPLIDYEIAAILSEIYVAQEDIYNSLVLATTPMIFAPDTFDPSRKEEVVEMLRWLLIEASGREGVLRTTYEKHLPRLREAAGAAD